MMYFKVMIYCVGWFTCHTNPEITQWNDPIVYSSPFRNINDCQDFANEIAKSKHYISVVGQGPFKGHEFLYAGVCEPLPDYIPPKIGN
jgi:hypothetical protein